MNIPESTKRTLTSRLSMHAREHWPDLASVKVRFRANFAYVDGEIKDGPTIPLGRLRYGGSSHRWGFGLYLGSHGGYEDQVLPSGDFSGAPEEALDCACALHLANVDAWRLDPP